MDGKKVKVLTAQQLTRHGVARVTRRLGLAIGTAEPLNPHELRHAFITLGLDAGGTLRDLQRAAAHADPRTTANYDRRRKALDTHPSYLVERYLAVTVRVGDDARGRAVERLKEADAAGAPISALVATTAGGTWGEPTDGLAVARAPRPQSTTVASSPDTVEGRHRRVPELARQRQPGLGRAAAQRRGVALARTFQIEATPEDQ